MGSDRLTKANESSHPVYIVREGLAQNVKIQILSTAEVIAVHLNTPPPFWDQKQRENSLNLPWSSAQNRIAQPVTRWNWYDNYEHIIFHDTRYTEPM